MKPLQKIVSHEFVQARGLPKGHGNDRILLECGHTVKRRHADRIAETQLVVRCEWCPDVVKPKAPPKPTKLRGSGYIRGMKEEIL